MSDVVKAVWIGFGAMTVAYWVGYLVGNYFGWREGFREASQLQRDIRSGGKRDATV